MTKWASTTMHVASGTTWEELDVLPAGTVVVVLRLHQAERDMAWMTPHERHGRVLALGPRGVGLLWTYALDYLPEDDS